MSGNLDLTVRMRPLYGYQLSLNSCFWTTDYAAVLSQTFPLRMSATLIW
jgi:hypothetical protein